MTIVAVEFPHALFGVRNGTFALRSFATTSRSEFQPSVPRREGARAQLWTFEISSPPMDRATTIAMEAWFANLSDQDWAFSAYDVFRQCTLGAGGGYNGANTEILFTDSGSNNLSFCSDFRLLEGATTALVKMAAARGQRSVSVKGLDSGLSGNVIVRAGDHIGIGQPGEMNLHMVTADAVCDGNGEARIHFIARLWKRALVNDVVNFYRPTGRFVMADESGELVRDSGMISTGSIVAIELPYQEPQE